MATDTIMRRPRRDQIHEQRSWVQAYQAFLRSPSEHFGLKVLPLVVLGVVPAAMADDILLPFLGVVDDIPTTLLVLFTAWRTWLRVRTYR